MSDAEQGGAAKPDAARPSLTVRALVADPELGLDLTVLAGAAGIERKVEHTRIQKSGLALAGHFHGIVPTRIQILGQTEQSYLERLEVADRKRALEGFFGLGLSCVVLCQGSRPFDADASGEGALPVPELLAAAEASGTPVLLSIERSSVTITKLHALLDDRLAPRVRLHGVLVDVFEVGLLLMGSSGIGKSESALDLVMRGHRLVADDVVDCDFRPPGMVFGAPADLLRHHLEVRGLGILNVKDLFGVTAVRERKRIDVVIRLAEWSKETEYDRLGLDERFNRILGVDIPELVIPVRPGRDMASILEVAARNELLKSAGHHPARQFFGKLEGSLVGAGDPPPTDRSRYRPSLEDESASPPPVRPHAPAIRTKPESQAPPPARPAPAAPRPQAGVPAPGTSSPGRYGAPRAPESSASIPVPKRRP